jgi:hypothetical protein
MFQRAGEEEIGCRPAWHGDADAGTIGVSRGMDGRVRRHEVRVFNFHVGRREVHVTVARGVNREESHIPCLGPGSVDDARDVGVLDQGDRHPEPRCQGSTEINRHPARRAGRGVLDGQHRIADVQGDTQFPRRRRRRSTTLGTGNARPRQKPDGMHCQCCDDKWALWRTLAVPNFRPSQRLAVRLPHR